MAAAAKPIRRRSGLTSRIDRRQRQRLARRHHRSARPATPAAIRGGRTRPRPHASAGSRRPQQRRRRVVRSGSTSRIDRRPHQRAARRHHRGARPPRPQRHGPRSPRNLAAIRGGRACPSRTHRPAAAGPSSGGDPSGARARPAASIVASASASPAGTTAARAPPRPLRSGAAGHAPGPTHQPAAAGPSSGGDVSCARARPAASIVARISAPPDVTTAARARHARNGTDLDRLATSLRSGAGGHAPAARIGRQPPAPAAEATRPALGLDQPHRSSPAPAPRPPAPPRRAPPRHARHGRASIALAPSLRCRGGRACPGSAPPLAAARSSAGGDQFGAQTWPAASIVTSASLATSVRSGAVGHAPAARINRQPPAPAAEATCPALGLDQPH